MTTGFNVQHSNLNGTVLDQDTQIKGDYTHVLPWAFLRLMISDEKNLEFRYRTSTREPSITELQPFIDNSDPLRTYVGNPALTPEYRHSLRMQYRYFNQFTFINLFSSLSVTFTDDRIVLSREIDQLKQKIQPVNSNGGWTTNGRLDFGLPIRPLGLEFEVENRLMYSTGSEFVEAAENKSRILRYTLELELENRNREIFDLEAGSRWTFNNVHYSLNDELNQTYVNTTLYSELSYYPTKEWTMYTSLNYRLYDQDVFGSGQNVALLEASISRLLLRDKVEVQFSVLDLLNQNQGVNFTNSSLYIQEERIESLGRYMMFKLTYRLSEFGRGGRGRRPF